ncbi:hypothetical protein HSX11_29290 [Oxalobacteraceae bacterium]|nr:hypothetical protein [Oxalobacteraceae bacterium]
MTTPPFDTSIPVLTEVLQENPAPNPPQPPQQQPDSAASTEAALPETAGLDGWDQAQWAALEQRLAERVLLQLQGRIDFVLEQRIKDSMADVLSHALQGLTSDIRSGLQDTLEQVVARAIAQELTHLRTKKSP